MLLRCNSASALCGSRCRHRQETDTSETLLENPKKLKAYAIQKLLTNNFGQIRGAQVIIDGQDTKAFDIRDHDYLLKKVNGLAPGTITRVKFKDSKENVGIQLADMVAGALHASIRTNKKQDHRYMRQIAYRFRGPQGDLWRFR